MSESELKRWTAPPPPKPATLSTNSTLLRRRLPRDTDTAPPPYMAELPRNVELDIFNIFPPVMVVTCG